MRRLTLPLLMLAPLLPAPAQAGPNVPLCFAIEKNYGDCLRKQSERRRHWEHEREEMEEWGGDPWDHPHRRPPPEDDCAAWVYELKANGCF